MTVAELINMLSNLPPDAEVLMFDADAEADAPVAGAMFDNKTVKLHTYGSAVTVAELINMLSNLPPDAEVLMFDADAEADAPVAGAMFDNKTVKLHTYSDE